MDGNTITSLEGDLAANAVNQVPSALITETYHSTIELGQFNGRIAIIKRCRHQHEPRTLPRFHNEVDALKLLSSHVSRLLHRGNSLSNTRSPLSSGKHYTALGLRYQPTHPHTTCRAGSESGQVRGQSSEVDTAHGRFNHIMEADI